MKEYPEVHQTGHVTLENTHMFATVMRDVDLGVQIAKDGRVWICINGVAFLRFSPHADGKMSKGKRAT